MNTISSFRPNWPLTRLFFTFNLTGSTGAAVKRRRRDRGKKESCRSNLLCSADKHLSCQSNSDGSCWFHKPHRAEDGGRRLSAASAVSESRRKDTDLETGTVITFILRSIPATIGRIRETTGIEPWTTGRKQFDPSEMNPPPKRKTPPPLHREGWESTYRQTQVRHRSIDTGSNTRCFRWTFDSLNTPGNFSNFTSFHRTD